jgi:hypothetical protein
MDFQTMLDLQAHFLKNWAGTLLDPDGFVHILNPDGLLPPLIWCFNAQHEFPKLAETLGPDQPLIGLRSLNLVARMETGRLLLDAAMGDHYADLLLAHLPEGPCFIGANCQSVPVALQVARRFLLAGRQCQSFISMEVEPGLPLPLRTRLLFGAESTMFNPFLRGDPDPAARWRLLFAEPEVEIVPGGHGQYFTPQNIGFLTSAIRRGMSDPAPRPASAPPTLRFTALGTEVDCGGAVILRIETGPDPLPEGLLLAHVWYNAATGDTLPVAGQPLDADGTVEVSVAAPVVPGLWDLIVFPTLPPVGPLHWQAHLEPAARVTVISREQAA